MERNDAEPKYKERIDRILLSTISGKASEIVPSDKKLQPISHAERTILFVIFDSN